jgi:hypothetical protein
MLTRQAIASKSQRARNMTETSGGSERECRQCTYRLASKAVISGVRIFTERATGQQFATSATDSSTLYAVDATARTCACRGFETDGMCSHLALALAQAGMPEPATCPACRGERGRRRTICSETIDPKLFSYQFATIGAVKRRIFKK